MSDFLCVLTMPNDLCTFCGEWVHVEGGDILHNDRWFCSDECVETIEAQHAAAEHRRIHGAPDWCKACGFDRYEHADDCPREAASQDPPCSASNTADPS